MGEANVCEALLRVPLNASKLRLLAGPEGYTRRGLSKILRLPAAPLSPDYKPAISSRYNQPLRLKYQ